MTYPSDEAMLILLGLHLGDGLTADGGSLRLDVSAPGTRETRLTLRPADAVLDELERRSWITTDTDPASITEAGRFWCQKWCRRKLGPGVIVRRFVGTQGATR